MRDSFEITDQQHEVEWKWVVEEVTRVWKLPISRALFLGSQRLLRELLMHGVVTGDQIARFANLPPGTDPRTLGAIPSHLAEAGVIEAVARIPSARPSRRGALVTVWRLTSRKALEGWLIRPPAQGVES